MVNRYIIIGAGVAGISAAEQIRRLSPDAEVQVINGEPYPFYRRLSLSTYLQGSTPLESLTVKQPEEYEALNIDVIQGRVARVEPQANRVVLTNGTPIAYTGSIVATGGHAIAPPIKGLDLKGVRLGYWDMDDTFWYEEQFKTVKNAVIVGAGVLGLELADCCNRAGLNVMMLQLGDRLGEPLTDTAAGEILAKRVRDTGADFRLLTSATEIVGDESGHVVAVRASNGEEFPADIVGVCCGIRPNASFLEGSGILVEKGCIVVDEHLRTNFDNIYAAGDCTWVQGGMMLGRRPNRTWQVATMQGIAAATNLMGQATVYNEGLFYNAGVLYDIPYTLLGVFDPPEGQGYTSRTYDPGKGDYNYFKLTFKDGKLVGALLMGRQRRTQILRKMIEGQMVVAGHEHQLMDAKFKPKHLKEVETAGDRDVEEKLATYSSR
ncbi:NAD(P)/FAD-dependent oxidoreductase [Synechococcus sp. PCC 7336]|uniref:NAD(P)/FAD-dependent oxidoreductase n=1 Tax=Synechococcus sp. PCC 7336 TaxID=195250 RepID=UPI00034D9134|nr:FAD-dependent oxidoreductase [Synechococcus sp. PCC 7336]